MKKDTNQQHKHTKEKLHIENTTKSSRQTHQITQQHKAQTHTKTKIKQT